MTGTVRIFEGRRWTIAASDARHCELRAENGETMVRSKFWVRRWTEAA
jgi:hypothetical protein